MTALDSLVVAGPVDLEYTVDIKGEGPRPLVYRGRPLQKGDIRRDLGPGHVRITEVTKQPAFDEPGMATGERSSELLRPS
jgi:hypothetical protein